MTDVARPEEAKLIERLTKDAADLGKILHKRGGYVKLHIQMSGSKRGLSKAGARRVKQIRNESPSFSPNFDERNGIK